MPATIGFSALLAVSSSIMEASVMISLQDRPVSCALFRRSSDQKFWFSLIIRCMKSSRLVFQYISYVLGMNRHASVAVSYPYLLQNTESVKARATVAESNISFLSRAAANRSIVRTLGMTRLTGVCLPLLSLR